MTAGLPGTGIGGLFYLGTAFLMPVRELLLTIRGRSSARRWRLVLLQVMLAASVIVGLWLTAWLLTAALPVAQYAVLQRMSRHIKHALGVAPGLLTWGILAGVLIGVEIVRLGCEVPITRKHRAVPKRSVGR